MVVRPPEPDTAALIKMGKEGDGSALNTLFARHHQKVLRIVRLRLKNSEMRALLRIQSMDILQEVFLHALKKLPDFELTSEGSLIHWLSRIVENVVKDRLDFVLAKKRDSESECSLDQTLLGASDHLRLRDIIAQDGTSPTQRIGKGDIKVVVDDLLLELDETDREIIIQRKLEGLTFGEIASFVGKNEDAVRKQFKRSFRKLLVLAENREDLRFF
jgi:RNA polymerase sigma-70 factor (subfamily 1)